MVSGSLGAPWQQGKETFSRNNLKAPVVRAQKCSEAGRTSQQVLHSASVEDEGALWVSNGSYGTALRG